MEKLRLKKNAERRLKGGHLWVFSNELVEVPSLEPGSLVELVNHNDKSYGLGFYNAGSLISIRLLNSKKSIDIDFFVKRIKKALKFRKRILPNENTFRLVFGESDFLPGLVIDLYESYAVMQFLSYGMEIRKDIIIEALLTVVPTIKGILEKDDSRYREIEGLKRNESVIYGEVEEDIVISENNIKYKVNLMKGQKTGFYLDQRMNRKFVSDISNGAKVLDCFTNQGGFAFGAIVGGAKKVIGIDSSQDVIDRANENLTLNSFENVRFEKADVFDYLKIERQIDNKWNMIVLDPPAFAKNRRSVSTAKAGYARLNSSAMKVLKKGGFLASSSCSQLIREDVFYNLIVREANKLNKKIKLIYRGMQSPDHPVLPAMQETKYLKFFVFQII